MIDHETPALARLNRTRESQYKILVHIISAFHSMFNDCAAIVQRNFLSHSCRLIARTKACQKVYRADALMHSDQSHVRVVLSIDAFVCAERRTAIRAAFLRFRSETFYFVVNYASRAWRNRILGSLRAF